MFKLIIGLLVFLALIFRIMFVFGGSVSFHYDMARDAFEAREIWQAHHLKILGPPTSTPGLYHGVFYYYLIAPVYGLGNGDPRVVAIFLALLNSLVIIPVMFLTKDLFKSTNLAMLAGFLYAVSFESVQYGPWISNPQPAMLTVALYFLFLRLWQKGKTYGLYWAVAMAALSTQFQFFLIYLFLLIPLFGYIFKIKTNSKQIGISLSVGFTGLISFVIAAVKFNTIGTSLSGLINISTSGAIDFRPEFGEFLLNYLNKFTDLFINNFFPTNVILGGILAFSVLYAIRKDKLLLFFLFSNLPIIIFGSHSNTYASIGLVVPAILGTLVLLKNIANKSRLFPVLIVALMIMSNLYAIFKYSPLGQVILVIPNQMILNSELKVVDQTYQLAAGKPFSINTLTLPLWTNTTWAYLYSWYGKNKYGYVPSFYGHNQIGLLGNDALPGAEKPLDKTFFIMEPSVGIPGDRYAWEIGAENSKTDLIKEYNYSGLILQYRKPK